MSTPPVDALLERLRAALAGRYRVDRAAGHGGMATVFLAEDLKHRRQVAIKLLDPELGALLGGDRFAREIEVAARLQHPHIVPLLDSGSGDSLFWYVMPWVEGESLRERLRQERRLGVEEAARLGAQVARALDYAHRQGVVHRDIKPENILLADRQAMVTDFGIARAIDAAGGPALTGTRVAVGTPEYMSPEQVAGGGELDGRSDVYGLGCVLYELLAGRPPFTGPAETLGHQHMNLPPPPLADLRPGTPPALAAAIDRALAKAPGDRFQTAGQLADALEGAVTKRVRVGRSPRRNPWMRAAAAVAVVVAALALAWRFGALEALLRSRPAQAGERQWVWVASFEGPPDDPSLAPAARDVIGSALDESGLLASVPQEQVRIALRNAGRADTARVDEELARQLAYRSSVRVVISGRISRLGGGYQIALRALDAENGQLHIAPAATARDERALIPTLTGLARELRAALGERPEALRAQSGVYDAGTPSFEAFKLYVAGRRRINANEPENAIPLLRQAIAVDPDFGAAWAGLGTAFGNLSMTDSALAAHREALRHPERLNEARRLDILAKIDNLEGRPERALERYDAMIALDPTPADAAVALHNKAGGLVTAGRTEEALALYRRAAKAWPVEVPPVTQASIVGTLISLGRFDEARTEIAKMKGISGTLSTLELAFNERQWDRGDSLAASILAQPEITLFYRMIAMISRASVLGARGQMADARATMDAIEARMVGPYEAWLSGLWWQRLQIDLAAGRDPDFMRGVREPGHVEYSKALRAAWDGDSSQARRSLRRAEELIHQPDYGASESASARADLVEASLDRRHRRWDEVIGRLAPKARVGTYEPGSELELMRQTYRWLVADAFAEAGRADSASAYLGLMLEPPGRPVHIVIANGLTETYVRARMTRILAGSNRIDEARREWETLSSTVTRPDPEIVALLDETRAALQAAGAMQASRR